MNRTALAFGVAPLWVPLLLGGVVALVEENGQIVWLVNVVSLVFSYGGTYLFGLPTFFFLRSRDWTAPWIAMVLGFVVGMLVFQLFLFLFSLALGNGVPLTLETMGRSFAELRLGSLIVFLAPGLLGALIGITLWVIARPDLTVSRHGPTDAISSSGPT